MTAVYAAAMIALVAGAVVAAIWRQAGSALSAAGSGLLVIVGFHAVISGTTTTLGLGGWLGFGHSALHLNGLSGLFLVLAGLTGSAVSLAFTEVPARRLVAVLHGTVLALVAVAIGADNAFLFFLAWEGLTVAIYLLASSDTGAPGSLAGGYFTGGLTKVGGAALFAAFALLYAHTGSFELSSWSAAAPHLAAGIRGVLFVLFLVAFATKIGVVPLQGALPVGYGAAPRAGAATLSVALAAGFYGVWRFVIEMLSPAPGWWGDVLLVLGALTAVSGILYAITQDDLRRFLGFSTVEHTGITLLGVGVALLGQANHNPVLAAAGLLAASLHVAAHGLAKTLALLGVDRVELATGRRTLDGLGGLGGRLPLTSRALMVATLTLAAMPPLGGFVSEWFTFEALLQAFRMHALLSQLLCALAAAVLALTAGLGVLAFAKFYGFMFLSTPREGARPTGEPSPSGVSLLPLGLLVLGLGVVAPWEIHLLGSGLRGALGFNPATETITHPLVLGPVFAKFSVLAPTWLGIVLPAFAVLSYLLARSGRRGTRREPVWISGSAAALERVQYRPSTYSNPILYVLRGPLGYRRTLRQTTGGEVGDVLVVETHVVNAADRFVYQPLKRLALTLASFVRRLQSGRLSDYLLYMLAVLIVVLALIPILH